jgi:hypothetical protein
MKTLQEIYLDWFNNFVTLQGFADHYGLSVDDADKLIAICRNVHLSLTGE